MERVKRKLELTKLNINCCDELLIDNNVINATYELWFDVTEYFADIEEINNISDDENNISYEEGDNYEELATIYYPPLKDILNIVHSASLHSGTYIDILDTMEKYYNRIKEDYKNYH